MRNLLGRLNARSAEDLNEIADAWHTPLVGRDRLSQISQIYRAMTKPPMVRAQWDELGAADQKVVRELLEIGDGGATIDELAARLGVEVEDVRDRCLGLYAQGVIAYEGSARTLPIGESPRLFVPIELGNSIRQIIREAQLGDISHLSLAELLALRSDQDIFDAAAQWGVDFIPGVSTRADVTELLSRRIAGSRNRAEQISRLGHDVRAVWERLTSVPQGTPVALDQIVGTGNERTLFNRRNAINELEDRLLAWSMMTEDGVRALFIPHELDSATTSTAEIANLPKPVSLVGQSAPFRPEAPLAWDLLVVLQRLFGPLAMPDADPLALSREAATYLNGMLWNRGTSLPPTGYVSLLIDLATELRLIEEPQGGATQFERTAAIREWRLKTWDEQNNQIRRIWMASTTWIDGQGRQDIQPWNVDWRGFRIKLLNHLATLDTANWYRVEDVANWIVEYDPGILGAGASVAVSHAASTNSRGEHARALGFLIEAMLSGVFSWLGLIQAIRPGESGTLMRTTTSLRDVVRAETTRGRGERPKPELSVADDLTVRVSAPEVIQVWSLLAFAEPVSLGAESVFRITGERVRAARNAGFRPDQIAHYIRRQNPVSLPDDFDIRIADLAENVAGIELTTSLAIDPGQEQSLRDIRALLETNGYVVHVSGKRLYVTIGTQRSVRVDADRIHALLESAGFGPVANRSRY